MKKVLNKLPEYMNVGMNNQYKYSILSAIFDDSRIEALSNLWLSKRIIKELLKDITKNAHVLQIGLTFGNEITAVYEKVNKKGKLDIFDVSETQINLAKEKYKNDNINIMNYNAAMPWDEKYDVVICYNLLHELPLQTRQKVMDNALSSLTNGGKAIFFDYAEPDLWNPLKWPLFFFNRMYRPFTESLWENSLESCCSKKDEFRWHHTYYRGNMYQKVVAVRKILSSEDVVKLTKIFKKKIK